MPKPLVIAIDGPAAVGKSTIGQLLAHTIGYFYVFDHEELYRTDAGQERFARRKVSYLYFDTGVMYRAVTWAALERGVDVADEQAISKLAHEIKINVVRPTVKDGRQYTVYADGQDVTWEIRSAEVDANVSPVSAYPGVREALTEQQRRIAQRGYVIMVGRDIGTVVMPDADLKIYLDASVETRARRRYDELSARGEQADYERVLSAMRRRDKIDSEREAAPLRCAEDARRINTDDLSVDQVLAKALELVNG